MSERGTDIISVEQASNLGGLLRARVGRSPDATAYLQYDAARGEWERFSWRQTADEVGRWQAALLREGLQPGERVGLILRNCRQWVVFDQAALGLGLVTVPLYTNDRPENVAYILREADVRLLLIEGEEQWSRLQEIHEQLTGLVRILTLEPVRSNESGVALKHMDDWLPSSPGELQVVAIAPDDLASIVYTSGTTGRSKGVMLSHRNILANAWASLQLIDVFPHDLFLSFLPLSHMLERMAGYYLPMMAGSGVAFARSIPQLAEDLVSVRPTIMISVPRIFERVHDKIEAKLATDPAPVRLLFRKAVDIGWRRFLHRQGRGDWSVSLLLWPLLDKLVAAKVKTKLGGRLRFAVCGGAALPPTVAQLFIALDIPIVQGYGLTETSPVISANSLEDNIPASVGPPLRNVEIRIGDNEELLTRSPCVMLGYWKHPEATAALIDGDGWLHTGDKARIEDGHLFITGRLKEIIVLANGEKVSPADMEMAIVADPLFDQVMVIGEGKPFLSALVVLNRDNYLPWAKGLGLEPEAPEDSQMQKALLEHIGGLLHAFPGYAQIFAVAIVDEPWTIEKGLMTPTMKLRRAPILERHAAEIERLYEGH